MFEKSKYYKNIKTGKTYELISTDIENKTENSKDESMVLFSGMDGLYYVQNQEEFFNNYEEKKL